MEQRQREKGEIVSEFIGEKFNTDRWENDQSIYKSEEIIKRKTPHSINTSLCW